MDDAKRLRKIQELEYEAPGMYSMAIEQEPFRTRLFYRENNNINVVIEFVTGMYRYRICGIGIAYDHKHFKLARTVHEKITEYVSRIKRIPSNLRSHL